MPCSFQFLGAAELYEALRKGLNFSAICDAD